MVFTPLAWICEACFIVLQLFCFWKLQQKLPQQKSLRFLMLCLTAVNIACISTHGNPKAYWVTIWTGRAIAMCWALWTIGDAVHVSERVHWSYRFPVLLNTLLYFKYMPWSVDTTYEALETYRALGFGLAMLILAVSLAAVVKHAQPWQLGLLVMLLCECSGATLTFVVGPSQIAPLLMSTVGMLVFAATLHSRVNGAPDRRPSLQKPLDASPLLPNEHRRSIATSN